MELPIVCGLAGFLLQKSTALRDPLEVVSRMAATLAHRGPDDRGAWVDPSGNIAFGHRRLNIIDLSLAGHQPMLSHSQRYILVLNGEIYNHWELRAELEGSGAVSWRGHSDTETLLACIDRWGLKGALERSVGMFALALWDTQSRVLSLARDRMGEKPLYYGWSRGAFLFASELKAFRAFPDFEPAVDPDALARYFSLNYVPAPRAIFKNTFKLLPGTTLSLSEGGQLVSDTYWSLDDAIHRPRFVGTPQDAVDEVERRLTLSIAQQSVADVPLGAFLSGGVDSSTIVSLMQSGARQPVRTFSIGFEEKDYDEAVFAAAIARHLGTIHTEMTVTSADALAVVPRLSEIWDEPFGDSSQIPTTILSALARQSVTVSLTGDGGDELFCGYDRYFSSQIVEKMPALPLLRGISQRVPRGWINASSGPIWPAVAHGITRRRLANVAHLLQGDNPQSRYIARLMHWKNTRLVTGANALHSGLREISPSAGIEHISLFSAIDAGNYLPDDILVKLDRAAMASSLETRAPLLDHRIVELALSLPVSYKWRGRRTKWPLRQILSKHVPRAFVDRPKRGFVVPIRQWLRGPLRDWADSLLSPTALAQDGLLNAEPILRAWHEHSAGTHDWENSLWSVLMFQSWRLTSGLPGASGGA